MFTNNVQTLALLHVISDKGVKRKVKETCTNLQVGGLVKQFRLDVAWLDACHFDSKFSHFLAHCL